MEKLLESIIGITETKIRVLDLLIKLSTRTGRVTKDELILIKESIIKQSRDGGNGRGS